MHTGMEKFVFSIEELSLSLCPRFRADIQKEFNEKKVATRVSLGVRAPVCVSKTCTKNSKGIIISLTRKQWPQGHDKVMAIDKTQTPCTTVGKDSA